MQTSTARQHIGPGAPEPAGPKPAGPPGPDATVANPGLDRVTIHDVTVVLVAHDGARWLTETLAALARQTRLPQRVVAVDTGSRDALLTVLANVSAPWLLLAVPHLLLAGLLRTAGFLLIRRPGRAADELVAVLSVLARPLRLRSARRRRAGTRTLPPAVAGRPLLASRRQRVRRFLEVVGDLIGGGVAPAAARVPAAETGRDAAAAHRPPGRTEPLRPAGARPGVLLVAALLLVTLAAARDLLGGAGLAGGRLLPAPAGAGELWSTYLGGWHFVGPGTDAPAPPYLAVVAALATVLGGSAQVAVDVLLLGAVPLSAATAYAASRRLTRSVPLRVWAAATYALLPVTTGAVATGRLGVAAAAVAVPPLLSAGLRLLAEDPRYAGWGRGWATGLGLAVAAAFAPTLYLLAGGLLATGAVAVAAAGLRRGSAAHLRRAGCALLAVAVPPLLLLP